MYLIRLPLWHGDGEGLHGSGGGGDPYVEWGLHEDELDSKQ